MLDLITVHTTLKNDVELIAALHEEATILAGQGEGQGYEHGHGQGHASFLSPTYINHVLQTTFSAVLTISLLYSIIVITLHKTNITKTFDIPKTKINNIAYQATNLLVNLYLGLYGIYHYTVTVPAMSTLLPTQRIIGYRHYVTFACLQMGYNIWSIPVGLFVVGESTTMLFHHVATIAVSSISTFSSFGFMYHTPFFFGLVEISSVPLAIMNYCKENKVWAESNIPTLAAVIRPIFAIMFLISRVIMWTPNIYDVLRSCFILLWTSSSSSLSFRVGMVVFIIAVLFLTALQYYWGILIVQGLSKLVAQLRVKKVKEVKKVE